MAERFELVVGVGEEGLRLDVAMAALPEIGSRTLAQRLIDAGQVAVDGEPRPKRHLLASGERVEIELRALHGAQPDPAAGEGVPHFIAYEDEHLLVVEKPAGVVVHPAPGHATGTLAQALAARGARGGARWRPGIVHRLDRDTSGLLVVAKGEAVHRALQELIRARRMARRYLALVDGRPASRTGTIDAALGRDRSHRTTVSTRTDRPRAARTHFRQLEAFPASTLVQARLETGRTHQIRAHFAAIGHPVLGDETYGGGTSGRLGLTRQFLHSARLSFAHPIGGAHIDCESELPADLRHALEAASREPANA